MRADPLEPRNDADVVAAILSGDREQYAVLVERYQAPLYRYALGMIGGPETAADLTQETLVKGFTRLASCRDPERFGSWLFRILRNACLDHLKSPRRESVPLESAASLLESDEDPEARLEQVELSRSLAAAMQTLPTLNREAFLMKHVEGLAYDEMAEVLGASESALKMRVKRAREALQAALGTLRELNGHV